jgi:hypothetical protein
LQGCNRTFLFSKNLLQPYFLFIFQPTGSRITVHDVGGRIEDDHVSVGNHGINHGITPYLKGKGCLSAAGDFLGKQ